MRHHARAQDGWFHCFDVEQCENCGDTVLSANAILVDRPVGTLHPLPAHDVAVTSDGDYCCTGCYDDLEEE